MSHRSWPSARNTRSTDAHDDDEPEDSSRVQQSPALGVRRHASHISMDMSAAAAAAAAEAPFMSQWPLLPPATPAAAGALQLPILRSTPQVVLHNSGAMVVYDPPAHELVVYKHTSPVLTGEDSIDGGAAAAAASLPSNFAAAAGSASSMLQPRWQGLQPFNAPFGMRHMQEDDSDDVNTSNVCRLCRRPFWTNYPHEADDEVPAARPYTTADYFHLLHATEEAADASREHSARVSEEKSDSRGRARGRRARPEQRGSVEIVEEMDDAGPAAGVRSRRAATSAASGEQEVPIVRTRHGRSSRAGAGMRIRRQQQTNLSNSSSTEDFTVLQADAAYTSVEDDEDDDAGDSSAAAPSAVIEDDDDDILECGLHRSSFNSGYYARFFREVSKLGSGGVGGVYLTHHVLDNVQLGTYAVKKIPVGNSRPWLLQVLKEVRALEGLHHRHIVAYKHSWLESFRPSDFGPEVPCLFMLMEYANRGTLANLIWPKHTPSSSTSAGGSSGGGAAAARSRMGVGTGPVPVHVMPEEDVWWVFIGTCLGLRHLHRAGVIHRDLKPENLLLSAETDALGREHGLRVLVSDFGNAILKGVPFARTGNTGTLAYAAPETLVEDKRVWERFVAGLNGAGGINAASTPSSPQPLSPPAPGMSPSPSGSPMNSGLGGVGAGGGASASGSNGRPLGIEYDEAQDLWSCGIILYAMAFGSLPFSANSPDALFNEIRLRGGENLVLPSHPQRSQEMKTIIRQLLSLDPSQRPGLEELLQRPALAKRREQRSAEFQQFRREQTRRTQTRSTTYRERTESYRPPVGMNSDGTERGEESHALVISPSLLAAPRSRSSRSASPAPLSLNPPAASPASSPSSSPSETPRRRSMSEESSGRSTTSEASTALVLASPVRDDTELPRLLRPVLAAFNLAFQLCTFATERKWLSADESCWRCLWSSSLEAVAQLALFVIKLWLALSMLVARPSSSSMYLHVFPQLLLLLLLFITALPATGSSWMQQAAVVVEERPALRRMVKRVRRWGQASAWRWPLARSAVAGLAWTITAGWLGVSESQWHWMLLNFAVALGQSIAIWSSVLAAHPSHTRHPHAVLHAMQRSPHVRAHMARSLSPLAVPLASSSASSGPTSAPLVPTGRPAPVARVPLLLPPTPVGTPTPATNSSQAPGRGGPRVVPRHALLR